MTTTTITTTTNTTTTTKENILSIFPDASRINIKNNDYVSVLDEDGSYREYFYYDIEKDVRLSYYLGWNLTVKSDIEFDLMKSMSEIISDGGQRNRVLEMFQKKEDNSPLSKDFIFFEEEDEYDYDNVEFRKKFNQALSEREDIERYLLSDAQFTVFDCIAA